MNMPDSLRHHAPHAVLRPLTAGALREAMADLPSNTPVLYEYVSSACIDYLGWPTRDFLFDREDQLPYLQAQRVCLGMDSAGNQALCIDLLPPDLPPPCLGRAIETASSPRVPLAARIEEYLADEMVAHYLEQQGAYPSEDDLLDVAQHFLARHTHADMLASCQRSLARHIAIVYNKVMFPEHANFVESGRYLQTGLLTEQLRGLAPGLPVYCARIRDGWTSYHLHTGSGMREYVDVVDCQHTAGCDRTEAACLNAFY